MFKKKKQRILSLIMSLALLFFNLSGVIGTQGVKAATSHVVISQIYGGGGNTGAPYTNDFIELYNPTDADVDLSTWSVQYASATGVFSTNKANLSGTIKSHGYYLFQGSGGAIGVPIPTADATGTINLSGTAGKVALANTNTAISGKTDPTVIDFVGFGTTASTYEGAGPAPAPSNITSIQRKDNNEIDPTALGNGNGNGWDTDNNNTDFVVSNPVRLPKNSSSPIEGGTVTPPTNVTVTGVALDKTTLDLKIGQVSAPLVATIAPTDATNKNAIWSTSNAAVATIVDGVVTAVAEGTATITITTEDQAKTSLCVVTVTANAPPAVAKTFNILAITDFHGSLLSSDATPLPIGGVLAKNLKEAKATNPNRTIIIGGGDLYQGSPISNVLRGVPVQEAFSNIGMEVTALGNHEFDWELDTVVNTTMTNATYSIVSSNLYNKNADGTKGTRKFAPYKIIEKDGVKIAFIGAITAESKNIIMPAYTDNYIFTDPATEVNACAAEIKAAGAADVIVAIIHAGNNTTAPTTGEIFDITNKLTNVSAVFGGHSHSKVTAVAANNGIPIYIANYGGKGYIDAKMSVQTDGTVSFVTPSAADYIAIDTTAANGYKNASPLQDPEVKAIVEAAIASVGPQFAEVIGNTTNDLTRTQIVKPWGESILGNWSSDVVKTSANADIGIANNGGLRTDILAGPITVGSIFYFMPFDNEINTVLVTKAQLKVILEQAVRDGGSGIQISGIKFAYDSTAVTGSRVWSITKEDGNAINDTETLKLAGPDFILTGGDGFAGFLDATVSNSMVKTGVLVRDALLANVKANNGINYVLNSRITNFTATKISVVATSDVHGNILNFDYGTNAAPSTGQGLAKVSTYVKGLRAANPNIMLIDNGDTIQGTPLVYYYNMIDKTTPYPMTAVMGAMGYDSWTLGNHEFNYGLEALNRIKDEAKTEGIDVLSANTYKSDNTNFVEPYTMKSFVVNGKTIDVAVLGLTTKTIPSWEDPAHYADLHFNDLVDEAKKWVPIVKAAGADVIIVSAHSGIEGAADVIPENQVKALATSVNGIDAIVAGHAHSTLNDLSLKNPDGKVVPILEPGKWAQKVSQIDIAVDATGIITGLTTKNVSMDSTIAEDPVITALIAPYQVKTLEYTATVLGKSSGEYKGDKQITEPTEIMELINKVQADAAGTQLSIAAPLSLKAYIPAGDITIKDIMGVYVYENFLYGVKMNGKQLKDWMEYTVRYYKQTTSSTDAIVKDPALNIPDYNLDQLYGASYDIDLSEPAGTIDPVTNLMASGNRIKNLKFNGKLVKDTDSFTVAINNYRFNGGGGFMAAAGISNTDASLVTYDSAKVLGDDGQVRSLMMKYVQDNKTITPSTSNNWKISTSSVQQEVGVTGVSLDKTDAEMNITDTLNLIATITPENATNKNVSFTSSNPLVATVDANGVVKAVAGGETTITVTTADGNFTDTFEVTVTIPDTTPPVITITSIENGKVYNDGVTPVITTDDSLAIVTMTLNGKNYNGEKITADGEYVLIVTAKDLAGNTSTSTINFTIDKTVPDTTPPVITITSIENGKVYKDGVTPVITTDDSSAIVTMTLNGKNYNGEKITADGEYVLIVTAKDLAGNTSTSTISFTIDKPAPAIAVTGVTLNSSSESLKVGKTYQLVATIQPGDASNKKLIWTSSDSKIATVDANGKVTALKVGTCTITVTTEDGHKVATCTFIIKAAITNVIPQTGSPIDLTVLLVLGGILLGAGTLFILKKKEEVK